MLHWSPNKAGLICSSINVNASIKKPLVNTRRTKWSTMQFSDKLESHFITGIILIWQTMLGSVPRVGIWYNIWFYILVQIFLVLYFSVMSIRGLDIFSDACTFGAILDDVIGVLADETSGPWFALRVGSFSSDLTIFLRVGNRSRSKLLCHTFSTLNHS